MKNNNKNYIWKECNNCGFYVKDLHICGNKYFSNLPSLKCYLMAIGMTLKNIEISTTQEELYDTDIETPYCVDEDDENDSGNLDVL
jgi:hypothetical protein